MNHIHECHRDGPRRWSKESGANPPGPATQSRLVVYVMRTGDGWPGEQAIAGYGSEAFGL
jgi:hypothetical protein